MTRVAFVPGHLCGRWLYEPQWRALEGRAERHLADVTRDDTVAGMAERLLAALPGPVVLVGLSLGGMVAMEAMAAAPGRVLGAVLVATDPTPAREKEIAWRAGEMARARAEGVAAYAAGFSEKFFAHDAGVAARLGPATREAMAAAPLDVLERQARALDARRAMIPRIEGFAAPVEVMAGGADRICPAKLHPPIAEACADARLTELPGVGHLVTLEAPEAVTARIDALMERIGG